MRVVLDTNVLISAIALPGGRGEEALLGVLEGDHQLVMSKPLLDELLGVLARKFGRDAEALARLAVFLSEIAVFVDPEHRLDIASDEADNRVLECAAAGAASFVVTGDKALLAFGRVGDVRIVSLKAFLAEVR